jgi:hypothetical protein
MIIGGARIRPIMSLCTGEYMHKKKAYHVSLGYNGWRKTLASIHVDIANNDAYKLKANFSDSVTYEHIADQS